MGQCLGERARLRPAGTTAAHLADVVLVLGNVGFDDAGVGRAGRHQREQRVARAPGLLAERDVAVALAT